MNKSFEHNSIPQEENTSQEDALTFEEIDEKRSEILRILEKVRLFPRIWKSSDEKTRDEIISLLERSLEELDSLEVDAQVDAQQEDADQEQTRPVDSVEKSAPKRRGIRTPEPAEEVERQFNQEGDYITIGDVHIPVCDLSPDDSEWQAVPGRVHLSGGKKFSEVRFVKDTHGLTYTAKPGEKMTFSEKHREKRLQSVDTVLEGRNELKAFNEAIASLGELTRIYEELNPDDTNYDTESSEIAGQIDKFIDPKALVGLLDLENSKIEDADDFSERVAEIIRTQQFLRNLDGNANDFIPSLDAHFKLTPYFEEKIAWFATLINRQLGLGNNAHLEKLVKNKEVLEWERLTAKGMTIMVGPRGTGKNKIVDFYCGKTNRPLFRYACSPNKEERDLTYDVELSDGEVVKIPTRILTAITTPNAVLELDELNLLQPNVAKFFNSLFDGDRTIFLNDQQIKAIPGVVFVGLMNPAGYAGVIDLPETIDDRSNIMTIGYPPFREIDPTTNHERFTYDEVLILKEHVHPISHLSDKKFKKIWDYVINGVGAQVSLDAKIVKVVKDLKNLVAISDRTRQVVDAYKTRIGDTRMERDVSLRGSIEAARFYSENHLWDVDLSKMPGWKPYWNPAQYAIAITYLPHTDTYRRGETDKDALNLILAETI